MVNEISELPVCSVCGVKINTTIEQHEKTTIHKIVSAKISDGSCSCNCSCKINKVNKYEFEDDDQVTELLSGLSVSVGLPEHEDELGPLVYPIDRIINPQKLTTKFKMVVNGRLINNSKQCQIVYDSSLDIY